MSAGSLKITPSEFFFQGFYSVCFEISKYLFYGTLINECLLVEATLKSHLRLKKSSYSLNEQSILVYGLMDNVEVTGRK